MNFYWVIQDKLAGSELPTRKTDIKWIITQGIKTIVSLTEIPLGSELICSFEVNVHHLPLRDLTAPSQQQIDTYVGLVGTQLAKNNTVLTHCLGGVGRTGTMLACYLVSLGDIPKKAIRRVRQKQPGSIHLRSQVLSVFEYGKRQERKNKDQLGIKKWEKDI